MNFNKTKSFIFLGALLAGGISGVSAMDEFPNERSIKQNPKTLRETDIGLYGKLKTAADTLWFLDQYDHDGSAEVGAKIATRDKNRKASIETASQETDVLPEIRAKMYMQENLPIPSDLKAAVELLEKENERIQANITRWIAELPLTD